MNREYTINYKDPAEAARTTIQIFHDQLVDLRGVTDKPDELEWEIRVYEHMIEDPEARLKAYQDARYDGDHMISKRRSVAKLGWGIK